MEVAARLAPGPRSDLRASRDRLLRNVNPRVAAAVGVLVQVRHALLLLVGTAHHRAELEDPERLPVEADPGLLEEIHRLQQQRPFEAQRLRKVGEFGSAGDAAEHRIEIVEALALVTWWGVRRVVGRRPTSRVPEMEAGVGTRGQPTP